MINAAVIIAALCIVGLLIVAISKTGSFPPKARLLCDVWATVEQKTTNDDTVSISINEPKSIKKTRGVHHA